MVFGEVVEGMDVVRKIEDVPTNGEKPEVGVIIDDCGIIAKYSKP